MTNEKLIDDLYWSAHYSGVFEKFRDDVSKKINENQNSDRISIIESVYNQYVNNGLINELDNIY